MTATKETLEDYTLRFAPRSYRKWSTRVVGISALGGIAYLADFAIGANIGISYGTTNALWGILIFAVVVMATGFPVGLLLGALQHRPRPGHPRQRLRLLRLGGHQRHLRDVHLHLLRARGLDHGPGPQTRARHTAVARLCGVHVDHLPVGHLRDESPFHTSGLDDAAVAGADGRAVRLSRREPSRVGRPVLRLPGREGCPRVRPRLDAAGRGRLPVAHRPDRRAERLPALHAAQNSGEQAQLVDVDVPRRPGLGHLRRHQADRRAVPGGVPDRQRRRQRGHREPAGAPVPGDLPRTSCRAGWR